MGASFKDYLKYSVITAGLIGGYCVAASQADAANFPSPTYNNLNVVGNLAVSGTFTAPTINFPTLETAGTLYVGIGRTNTLEVFTASGNSNFVNLGNGGFTFQLGGSNQNYSFENSAGVDMLTVGGNNNQVTLQNTLVYSPVTSLTTGTWQPSVNGSEFENLVWTGSPTVSTHALDIHFLQDEMDVNMGVTGGGIQRLMHWHALIDGPAASGMTGNAAVLYAALNINESTGNGPANNSATYIVAHMGATAAANDGGTSLAAGSALGQLFGTNPTVTLLSGATFWGSAIGEEVDVEVDNGASTNSKIGIQVVQTVGDRQQGAFSDVGVSLNNQPDAGIPGWQTGFGVNRNGGGWPIASGGTMFAAIGNDALAADPNPGNVVANAFDVHIARITSDTFWAPALEVAGSGTTQIGSLQITPTASGASISSNNYQSSVSGGVTVGGGNTCPNNGADGLIHWWGPHGGQYSASGAAGAIAPGTVINIDVPDYLQSAGSEPSNPVTLHGPCAGPPTVNLVWTRGTVLDMTNNGSIKLPPTTVQVASGVTASGTTLAGATLIVSGFSVITTCAASAGVIIPATPLNEVFTILDRASTSGCLIYPPSGAAWEGGTVNVPAAVASGDAVRAIMVTSGAGRLY